MERLKADSTLAVNHKLELAHHAREAELARERMLAEVKMNELSAVAHQVFALLQCALHEVN